MTIATTGTSSRTPIKSRDCSLLLESTRDCRWRSPEVEHWVWVLGQEVQHPGHSRGCVGLESQFLSCVFVHDVKGVLHYGCVTFTACCIAEEAAEIALGG